MAITLETATPAGLDEVVEAVASWQHEGGPIQLHPGDLGWKWRFGAEVLARDVRVWRRDREPVAVGLADGVDLVRLALAPSIDEDEEVAAQLQADLSDPARGVLPHRGAVEARFGAALRRLLTVDGWKADEPWTPLSRNLIEPVEEVGLRVDVVDSQTVRERVAVQRAAFASSTFTEEAWHQMAAASPYRRGRCLVGVAADGVAVAAVTVWSAGPGRPGLLEPVGVHPEHRGHGYGRAISVAAAAALRDMGASSATVCTPSANVGAVATYAAAGFRRLPDVTDFRAPG